MTQLEEMIRRLPPELRQEAEDFVRFLAEKCRRRQKEPMSLDWFGGLADLRDQYTSVELQHHATRWMAGDK